MEDDNRVKRRKPNSQEDSQAGTADAGEELTENENDVANGTLPLSALFCFVCYTSLCLIDVGVEDPALDNKTAEPNVEDGLLADATVCFFFCLSL